jgi:hypothetical protein
MITTSSIRIDSKAKNLIVSDYVVRHVSNSDEEDSGWRFQAVIKNDSSSCLTDLSYSLRYFDTGNRFLGLDEGFTLGSDELARDQDLSVNIDLNIPSDATYAVFAIKAKKTNFIEKHNFILFGAAILIAAIILFFSKGEK